MSEFTEDPSVSLMDKVTYSVPASDSAFVVSRETVAFQSYQPSYSTANNDVISIKIPAQFRSMEPLESFLNFKVTSSDADARIKGSVKRLFKTLIISSIKTGEELERINEVGLLEKILVDCTASKQYRERSGMLEGVADGLLTNSDHSYYFPRLVTGYSPSADIASLAAATTLLRTPVDPYSHPLATSWMAPAPVADPDGAGILSDAKNTVIGGPRYYTVHFHSSGILTSRKYLHLQQLGGLEIKLEFYPEATINAGGTARTFTVSDINFVASLVSFNDKVKAMIAKAADNGGMNLVFDTWFAGNKTDTATEFNLELNKPASNVRMALAMKRVPTNVTDATKDSFASDAKNFYSYQWEMGGVTYPSKPCSNPAWALTELHKSFGYWNSIHTNNITYEEFTSANGTAIAPPKHYVAIDLESDPSSFGTGQSSKNGNLIRLKYTCTASTNYRFDYFLHYTRVLMIDGDSIQKKE